MNTATKLKAATGSVPWAFVAVFVGLILLFAAFEVGRVTAPTAPPAPAGPPPGATMPNVVGMTAQNAADLMAGKLGIASLSVTGLSNPDELITSQNPPEGTPITPSTKVTLYTAAAGSATTPTDTPTTSSTPTSSSAAATTAPTTPP